MAEPLAPERAELKLVLGDSFPVHASGQFGPFDPLGLITRLTGFDRLEVVGCRESSRPMESEEILQPAREELGLFFSRGELPGGHVHKIPSQRPEYSYRDVGGIDDEEIRIDQEVASDIGH